MSDEIIYTDEITLKNISSLHKLLFDNIGSYGNTIDVPNENIYNLKELLYSIICDNKLTTYLTIETKYKYSKTFYYEGGINDSKASDFLNNSIKINNLIIKLTENNTVIINIDSNDNKFILLVQDKLITSKLIKQNENTIEIECIF